MNPREVAKRLHENEIKVIQALSAKGTATTEELSQLTRLARDAVEKASDWASTKGVVSFEEKVSQFYSLTDEGIDYAENGLPEQNLRKLLVHGPQDIANLKQTFQNLNIALAWIRRNGWANIQKGAIQLTEKGRKVDDTPKERLLKDLNKPTPQDGDALTKDELMLLAQMVKRKLVKKHEETERSVAITEFGRQVLPELEKTEFARIITQLTPEMLVNKSWKGGSFQRYDVTLPAPNLTPSPSM